MALSLFDQSLIAALKRLLSHISFGRLTVSFPDGSQFHYGNSVSPQATLHIRSMRAIRRILSSGAAIGLAEAYMAEEVDTPDLYQLLQLGVANLAFYEESEKRHPLRNFVMKLYHRMRANTKAGSRRNIAAHYDLGNDFYQLWLDPSMTYSAALFELNDSLETAQQRKYETIARMADLRPDSHVLEIGCGWGGFAEYAAKHIGCQVTGITISQEQFGYASARMQRQGLNDKVELRLQDYRDVPQQSFDRAVSIEMFEAVGERYWPTFFNKLKDVLKPGGRAGLQIITIEEPYFQDYQGSTDFIQQYIFPGGMLPSPARLRQEIEDAGLRWRQDFGLAASYARTLLDWNQRFQAAWPQVQALRANFDERFRRMWEFYLIYCAVGFESPRLDVKQIALARSA